MSFVVYVPQLAEPSCFGLHVGAVVDPNITAETAETFILEKEMLLNFFSTNSKRT